MSRPNLRTVPVQRRCTHGEITLAGTTRQYDGKISLVVGFCMGWSVSTAERDEHFLRSATQSLQRARVLFLQLPSLLMVDLDIFVLPKINLARLEISLRVFALKGVATLLAIHYFCMRVNERAKVKDSRPNQSTRQPTRSLCRFEAGPRRIRC